MARFERIAELRLARSRLIKLLLSTIELDLKLLHSTEADPAVIARHHSAFAEFIDTLARHVQHPHVQQYSEMNREEFVRAEVDFLNQYARELATRNDALRDLLLIRTAPYLPHYPLEDMLERMAETARTGRPNQFTHGQRSTVQKFLDPAQYYGKTIAAEYFAEAPAPKSIQLGGDASAGNPPDDEDADEARKDAEETSRSLLRMKAQVIADRLEKYGGNRKAVLVTALIKVKEVLSREDPAVIDPTGGGVESALARGTAAPAVELVSAKPRDLVLVYHGNAGNKAVFHCGLSNASLNRTSVGANLPMLTAPSASLVLVGPNRVTRGSAYVVSTNTETDPVDELARLIKALDFTSEFMTLARRSESTAPDTAEAAKADADMLDFAEEL